MKELTTTQDERFDRQQKMLKMICIMVMMASIILCTYVSLFSTKLKGLNIILMAFSEPSLKYMSLSGIPTGIFIGIVMGSLICLFVYMEYSVNKTYAPMLSEGSAKWQTKSEKEKWDAEKVEKEPDMDTYDPDWSSMNMIYSENQRMTINDRKSHFNNNCLVIGVAGTGKSRGLIKPNLLQMNASFVVTDPSGELLINLGKVLQNHNYKIKIFNVEEMRYSNGYNPLEYIRDEQGIAMVIDCFIKNTQKTEKVGGDQFFDNAERMLYAACICLLVNHIETRSLKNFGTIVKLISMSSVDEKDPDIRSNLDKIFEQLPDDALAKKFYSAFKQATGKTLKSIIISCLVRLQPFMFEPVKNLTQYDELELDRIGDEKTAIFIITPQADRTYNFLTSMLYHQMFETIYHKGENNMANGKSERMPYHIRCLMDEFANQGDIPEFPSKLSTSRKYNISSTIILQDKQQIEAMFEKNYKELMSNCDKQLFLGSSEQDVLEWVSKKLGDSTIEQMSENGIGGQGKASRSKQKKKRVLMTPDEVGRLSDKQCILFTRGCPPVLDLKYNYESHPLYPQTGDADEKNKFLYRKMSAYDNKNVKHKVNMLNAENELNKLLIENERIEVGRKAAEARCSGLSGSKEEEELSFIAAQEIAADEFAKQNMECVPVVVLDNVVERTIPLLLNFQYEQNNKAPIVILYKRKNNDTMTGYAYDNESGTMFGILSKSRYAIFSPEGQQGNEIIKFRLKNVNLDSFRKEAKKIYMSAAE